MSKYYYFEIETKTETDGIDTSILHTLLNKTGQINGLGVLVKSDGTLILSGATIANNFQHCLTKTFFTLNGAFKGLEGLHISVEKVSIKKLKD